MSRKTQTSSSNRKCNEFGARVSLTTGVGNAHGATCGSPTCKVSQSISTVSGPDLEPAVAATKRNDFNYNLNCSFEYRVLKWDTYNRAICLLSWVVKEKAYWTLTAHGPSLTDCPDAVKECLVLRAFLLEWSKARCESFGLDTCMAPANIPLSVSWLVLLVLCRREALRMLKHPRVNY